MSHGINPYFRPSANPSPERPMKTQTAAGATTSGSSIALIRLGAIPNAAIADTIEGTGREYPAGLRWNASIATATADAIPAVFANAEKSIARFMLSNRIVQVVAVHQVHSENGRATLSSCRINQS